VKMYLTKHGGGQGEVKEVVVRCDEQSGKVVLGIDNEIIGMEPDEAEALAAAIRVHAKVGAQM